MPETQVHSNSIGPDPQEQAAELFGFANAELTDLGGLQNFVYEFAYDGRSWILRLTPGANRTEHMVLAELDWIRYLAGRGVSVSEPVRSKNGRWTEVIPADDGYFTCAVFAKAPGRKVGYPECLRDDGLYERLGRLTGRLHRLSRSYRPDARYGPRHDWSGNWFLRHVGLVPATQPRVRAACAELMETLRTLPRDEDAFGLIHGDMGVGNFTVDEDGGITLFDFDEAQYSWFVEDIAVQLYYLVYVYGGEEGRRLREEQAERFMRHFMKGYREEYALDEKWLRLIPLFLRVRELIVYIGAFRNRDGVDETFSRSDNQWFTDWIAEARARIESGAPIVDIWN
jgi:Ser/Thr protein kinase RdoA (MazF antagonist)